MTPYGINISHDTFEFFWYKRKRQKLACILRKNKCLVGYSVVYHSKSTDGRCSTCLNGRITADVWKIKFDFPRGYHRRFFTELVGCPSRFCTCFDHS